MAREIKHKADYDEAINGDRRLAMMKVFRNSIGDQVYLQCVCVCVHCGQTCRRDTVSVSPSRRDIAWLASRPGGDPLHCFLVTSLQDILA